jgi:hypothetical protein
MTTISITDEHVERLRAMLGSRVKDLQLIPREEGVVLLGHATTYYAKQLAQHFVQKWLQVSGLVNQIVVHQTVPEPDGSEFV